MKKRKLDTLSRERCKQLIQKLDAKLVASYTPLDWAQKLDQLFVLFDGKVDSKLLATFFEDKGLTNLAQKFSKRHKLIDKTGFISIISNESFTDFQEEETAEGAGSEKKKPTVKDTGKSTRKDAPEPTLIESFFGELEYKPEEKKEDESLAHKYIEGGLTDAEMTELLADIASGGVVEVDDYEHVASLNELFSISKKEEEQDDTASETSEEIAASIKSHKDDEGEDVKAFRDNLISILDQAKNSYENMEKDEAEAESEPEPEPPVAEEEEKAEDEELPEGKDQPMWAQFLSEDQMEVMMGSKREKPDEMEEEATQDNRDTEEGIEVEDSVYSGDPIIEEEESAGIPLADILEDRKEEFIEVIFAGSADSYKKAVKKIEKFGSWKETSAYIQKEIFAKNDVDMFVGATVDFTDRLHRFFNKSRNT